MRLQINQISSKYAVRKLTEMDIDAVYELERGNPFYYRYCPPAVTRESILKDMEALPPKKHMRINIILDFGIRKNS